MCTLLQEKLKREYQTKRSTNRNGHSSMDMPYQTDVSKTALNLDEPTSLLGKSQMVSNVPPT